MTVEEAKKKLESSQECASGRERSIYETPPSNEEVRSVLEEAGLPEDEIPMVNPKRLAPARLESAERKG